MLDPDSGFPYMGRVILVALCWLPVYINQFILFFDRENFPCGPPASFVFTAYFLGHANSAINPAVYAMFNRNFGKGVRDVLLCSCYRNRRIASQTNPHRNRRNIADEPNIDDTRVRPPGVCILRLFEEAKTSSSETVKRGGLLKEIV